ncbi:MAG: dATP/dGTP diphosphohydrolase domain-containing protein [Pseudomonadota bacterium]
MNENPKAIAARKLQKKPSKLIPWRILEGVGRAMQEGQKYGKYNYRQQPILATTYVEAIFRHAMLEWAAGIDEDPDPNSEGLHPLYKVIANCIVVLDSIEEKTLIDDRLWREVVDPDTQELQVYDEKGYLIS